MKDSTKNLLRWISFLPASFILGFLATFPLHWILYLAFSLNESTILGFIEFPNGINIEPIEHFLSPIVLMATAIFCAFKIAPKYKFQASLSIGVLWLIIILFGFIIMPKSVSFETRTVFTFLTIIICLFINWFKKK
jgi:hypothetical protein